MAPLEEATTAAPAAAEAGGEWLSDEYTLGMASLSVALLLLWLILQSICDRLLAERPRAAPEGAGVSGCGCAPGLGRLHPLLPSRGLDRSKAPATSAAVAAVAAVAASAWAPPARATGGAFADEAGSRRAGSGVGAAPTGSPATRLSGSVRARGSGDLPSRPGAAQRRGHISMQNYLCFLRTCRDMFAVLTALSAFMTVPLWGFEPLLAGFIGGSASLTAPLSEGSEMWMSDLALPMVKMLYSMTVLYSIVFACFASRFIQECSERERAIADTPEKRKMRRTIWLQRLPLSDGVWGAKEFEYTDEDLARVTQDLKVEVLKFLQEKKKQDLWLQAAKLKPFRSGGGESEANKRLLTKKDRSSSWHGSSQKAFSPATSPAPPATGAAALVAAPAPQTTPPSQAAAVSEQTPARAPALPTATPPALGGDGGAFPAPAGGPPAREGDAVKRASGSTFQRSGSMHLPRKRAGRLTIESIEIAPHIEELHAVSLARRDCAELAELYDELRGRAVAAGGGGMCGGCRWWRARWYARRRRLLVDRSEELRARQLQLELETKRLSGSAFITFASQSECSLLLNKVPPWWDCNNWFFRNTFSFGRPPFAAVTLFCYRAPHPSDVKWHNLHTKSHYRRIRYWLLTVLVAAVTLGLTAGVEELSKEVASELGGDSLLHGKLLSALPPVLLLAINNLVLPYSILYIALAERNRQRSNEQLRQLYINFYFLLLTSIVVPFFGFGTLYELADVAWKYFQKRRTDWVSEQVASVLLDISGNFTLRYVMSAVFLSNPFVLLKAPCYTLFQLLRVKLFALPKREREQCRKPMEFAWGFWYAWVLIIAATGTIYGVVLPGIYPLMALFFVSRHLIESYAFKHRLTDVGPDSEGAYAAAVVHHWLLVGVAWLCMMGAFFMTICRQRGDCPEWLSPWGAGALAATPLVAVPISCLRKRHAVLGMTVSEREDSGEEDLEEDDDDELGSMNWKASQAVEADPMIEGILAELKRRDPKVREEVLRELRGGRSVMQIWEELLRSSDVAGDQQPAVFDGFGRSEIRPAMSV